MDSQGVMAEVGSALTHSKTALPINAPPQSANSSIDGAVSGTRLILSDFQSAYQ